MPVKNGYTFGGWYERDLAGAPVAKIEKGSYGNRVFYAKWNKINYTITYNLNGGQFTAPPISYTIESETCAACSERSAMLSQAGTKARN